MVSATIGFTRKACSFGAFFVVQSTTCSPFQVKPIGIVRGVPSLAT
jgi:hypothetical protein